MFKVLLVDDELIARQYMRHLIDWEGQGMIICGEAGNGLEAIELMEREQPHIVIADINMAGMDGVELSRYMSANQAGRIRLIILSSYDNYEYVRETMKNGAVDYLLKHRLDAAGLLDILSKVKQEITDSEEKPQHLNYIEKNWSALNQDVARNYFKELLLGLDEQFPKIEDYFRHLSPIGARNLVVTVIQTSEQRGPAQGQTVSERNKRMRSILDMVQQGIAQTDNGIAVELEYGKFAVMTAFPQGRSENDIHQRLHACLQRIASSLEMYLNLQVSFASGPICHKFSQIPLSYSSALRDLAREWPAADSYIEQAEVFTLTLHQEKSLLQAVEQFDRFKTDMLLDDLFEALGSLPYDSPSVSNAVNELIQLADKIWRKAGSKDQDYVDDDLPLRYDPASPETVDSAKDRVKQLFRQLIGKLSPEPEQASYSPYVYSAMQYVNSRYAENLSLDLAAERAGITASYLGRLFKQETGVYFTDYLNQIRIDNAKRLIRSGRYKVNQIYERVGFSGYNYFFKVFKDSVGMTPHQYAKSREEPDGPSS